MTRRQLALLGTLCGVMVVSMPGTGQDSTVAAKSPAAAERAPKLEHFNVALVDQSLDPCQDFYKYACSKWQAANPIPPDQASWNTWSGLQYWNENILRQAMQNAAAKTANRADYEQKIGDYWSACMDESAIDAAGARELQPDLERINRMTSKAQLGAELAHLHMSLPGAWAAGDNQTAAPMFGLGQGQDFDDATKVVAFIDQGGLALPNRDFYLKDDAKSKEIRGKYEAHIGRMFRLAGEKEPHAGDDEGCACD